MSDSTNHNVIGTDSVLPTYNPEGLWKTWAINEIYTGLQGKNRYVPKVNDHVIEPVSNTRYRVKSLDQVTLLAELEALGGNNSLALTSTDMLFASGPGWPSQAYRIYLDNTVFPYRLSVDCFLSIRSVNAAYAKIIYGSIYGDYEVISQVFDGSGNLVTDQVGMDLLAVEPGWQNYHIKSLKTCHCTRNFMDGDVLTVVTFSADGGILNTTPLSVVNSNFIRDQNAPQRYITHISVRSPFVSETNPELILLPLNWTKSSMNMMGVLHYSDGSEAVLPIDGNKFTLRGIDQLLSTIPGHEINMVLHYALEPSEASYHESASFNNGITSNLRVRLVDANFSYSVKLFVFPYWDTTVQGYRLKWYLFNLERNVYRDVTGNVMFAANSPLFDGHQYGATQRIQVSLNLRDVMPTFKPFVHTQIVEISLYGTPQDYPTPWLVKHNVSDVKPYGAALKAKRVNTNVLNLKSGLANFDLWLTKLYKESFPLSETPYELDAFIAPTHFHVINAGQTTSFEINMWDQDLVLPALVTMYKNVYIVFSAQLPAGELFLSMAGLNIQV